MFTAQTAEEAELGAAASHSTLRDCQTTASVPRALCSSK